MHDEEHVKTEDVKWASVKFVKLKIGMYSTSGNVAMTKYGRFYVFKKCFHHKKRGFVSCFTNSSFHS